MKNFAFRLFGIILLTTQIIACGGGGGSSDEIQARSGAAAAVGNGHITNNASCTHIVPNGTYSTSIDASSYPAGSTVCAETDGQVIFTGSFMPRNYNMRGFVVMSSLEKELGNGIFERMSFVGGPSCGNRINTAAGNNTVIRDSAFYGLGGRYLFLSYQASGIQVVNAIFRVDGGWGATNACNEWEPNAALNFYDTNNALCDGCVNIDQRPTAASNSETLGGLGVNAHTTNLCHSVEIRNSVSYNAESFWADGNGRCNTQYTNNKGPMNFNLVGTATITDSTGSTCNAWRGSVNTNNSSMGSGNCASSGAGVALNLDTQFLNDPRWRNEMCGGFSNRADGWCATQMSLSDYIRQ